MTTGKAFKDVLGVPWPSEVQCSCGHGAHATCCWGLLRRSHRQDLILKVL